MPAAHEGTYSINHAGGKVLGCIDIVYSPDDGGFYAQQYDFTRKDGATRTSRKIYRTREALVGALNSGCHRFGKWD